MSVTITIRSTADNVLEDIKEKITSIVENKELLLLQVASGILAEVHNRIHDQGKRADGSDIGRYSNQYLRTRERFRRGSDPKIIFSLTSQMETDFTIVSEGNRVGLGFNNIENFKKATWLEERFKNVYNLSEEEEQAVVNIGEEYINDLFE